MVGGWRGRGDVDWRGVEEEVVHGKRGWGEEMGGYSVCRNTICAFPSGSRKGVSGTARQRGTWTITLAVRGVRADLSAEIVLEIHITRRCGMQTI